MIDYWDGCYDAGWKGIITDAAFAHPAKFSRGLIFRIIEHALADGLIQPGGVVLDPFGGVALGALPALMNGLSWVGCELEQKFVDMGRENIALWNSRFSGMPKWTGTAQLLQGDSRRLGEAVGAAGLVVGSPPYADGGVAHNNRDYAPGKIEQAKAIGATAGRATWGHNKGSNGQDDYGHTPGQLGAMPIGQALVVGSPPYAGSVNQSEAANDTEARIERMRAAGIDVDNRANVGGGNGVARQAQSYGKTEGQLGSMIVGSPPFAGSVGSDDPQKRGGLLVSDPKRAGDVNLTGSYGTSEGQLASMVVGSPPFENKMAVDDTDFFKRHRAEMGRNPNANGGTPLDYGAFPGQLGNDTGETFWTAARLIVEQCWLLLPPGGAAVWVVKDYVKNGAIVPFSEQWRALCEACGFETLHIHRAMLVKRRGAQAGFDGAMVSKDVSRKSFFRRLAEAKGSPEINWETVLCMVKR